MFVYWFSVTASSMLCSIIPKEEEIISIMEIRRIAYSHHAKTLHLLLFCFKQRGREHVTCFFSSSFLKK